MKAKFYNPELEDFETVDTENLENDSGQDWTEEMLINYINDICPQNSELEII